jgi:hypothetical protein
MLSGVTEPATRRVDLFVVPVELIRAEVQLAPEDVSVRLASLALPEHLHTGPAHLTGHVRSGDVKLSYYAANERSADGQTAVNLGVANVRGSIRESGSGSSVTLVIVGSLATLVFVLAFLATLIVGAVGVVMGDGSFSVLAVGAAGYGGLTYLYRRHVARLRDQLLRAIGAE